MIRLSNDQVIDIALTTAPDHNHLLARARVVRVEDSQHLRLLFAGTM